MPGGAGRGAEGATGRQTGGHSGGGPERPRQEVAAGARTAGTRGVAGAPLGRCVRLRLRGARPERRPTSPGGLGEGSGLGRAMGTCREPNAGWPTGSAQPLASLLGTGGPSEGAGPSSPPAPGGCSFGRWATKPAPTPRPESPWPRQGNRPTARHPRGQRWPRAPLGREGGGHGATRRGVSTVSVRPRPHRRAARVPPGEAVCPAGPGAGRAAVRALTGGSCGCLTGSWLPGNPRRLITAATVISQKENKKIKEEKKGERKKVRKKKPGERWACESENGLFN